MDQTAVAKSLGISRAYLRRVECLALYKVYARFQELRRLQNMI